MKKSSVFQLYKLFKEDCMLKSQMKTVHFTFFDVKGIVHLEFIPQGHTVNQVYYVESLKLCI
jgi:hypothetical protein